MRLEIEKNDVYPSDDIGYLSIKVDEDYLLENLRNSSIKHYAEQELGMIHESNYSLDDFDRSDIVDYLEDEGYDFIERVTYEEMIECLESDGYIVSEKPLITKNNLDYVDNTYLEEIIGKFKNANWEERENMYHNIMNL